MRDFDKRVEPQTRRSMVPSRRGSLPLAERIEREKHSNDLSAVERWLIS